MLQDTSVRMMTSCWQPAKDQVLTAQVANGPGPKFDKVYVQGVRGVSPKGKDKEQMGDEEVWLLVS